MNLRVQYPIDLVSSANVHGTVQAKMSRDGRHRDTAYYMLLSASRELRLKPEVPAVVVFTRASPKLITDEHDNLRHAFKHTVDGVALFLGVKDGDKRVSWRYKQERGSPSSLRLIPGQSRVFIDITWGVALVCSRCGINAPLNTPEWLEFENKHGKIILCPEHAVGVET